MHGGGRALFFCAQIVLWSASAQAVEWWDWHITELHFQYGTLNNTTPLGGGTSENVILTLQHSSGWKWGEVFLFVDNQHFIGNADRPGGTDLYSEYYVQFSLRKLAGFRGLGWIYDMGPRLGYNYGADPKVHKILPGWRLALRPHGFRFLNFDFFAFMDISPGIAGGGAPRETTSWQADMNWARPFDIGGHGFSIEGHLEYTPGRGTEVGTRASWMILSQTQFRWDVGRALGLGAKRLFAGVEMQFFINKIGDPRTDEYAAQALLVWRL